MHLILGKQTSELPRALSFYFLARQLVTNCFRRKGTIFFSCLTISTLFWTSTAAIREYQLALKLTKSYQIILLSHKTNSKWKVCVSICITTDEFSLRLWNRGCLLSLVKTECYFITQSRKTIFKSHMMKPIVK